MNNNSDKTHINRVNPEVARNLASTGNAWNSNAPPLPSSLPFGEASGVGDDDDDVYRPTSPPPSYLTDKSVLRNQANTNKKDLSTDSDVNKKYSRIIKLTT